MRKWPKWLGVILFLAIGGVLIFSSVKLRRDDLEDRARLHEISRQYDEVFTPLQQRRKELKEEIEALKLRHESGTDGCGVTAVLCTAPDERIMTDIAPVLREYGFVGVIAVGEDSMPGDSGCLSVEETKTLLDRGWELCYRVESGTSMENLRSLVQKLDLPLPTCAYFPEGTCNSAWESILRGVGVQAIVQPRKTKGSSCGDEVLHILAMGSFEEEVKDTCVSITGTGSAFVVTVGYTDSSELYQEDNFSLMLQTLQSLEKTAQIRIGTIADAYADSGIGGKTEAELDRDYQEKIAALQQELETVELEMQAVQQQSETYES